MAKYPRIIAQRGDNDFLIQVNKFHSRVCEGGRQQPVIYPPNWTDSILKFGYWDDYEGPPGKVNELLRDAVEDPSGIVDFSSETEVRRRKYIERLSRKAAE